MNYTVNEQQIPVDLQSLYLKTHSTYKVTCTFVEQLCLQTYKWE